MSIVATGGIETTVDGYKYHTFTGVGEGVGPFVVTTGGDVEYFVVAGGGGGGGIYYAGGGGGGEVKTGTLTLTTGNKTVTVGSGGSRGNDGSDGGVGGNSVFDTITSAGGGGGHYGNSLGSPDHSDGHGGAVKTGGHGCESSIVEGGGGGGGAGVTNAGADGSSTKGGNGGDGVEWPVGSGNYYAGGGGGGAYYNKTKGFGGLGGGGNGSQNGTNAQNGASNTGGGGGGSWWGSGDPAGIGGSGIVIIRYSTSLSPIDVTLETTLEDAIADFLLSFPINGFENVTVQYHLIADTFDDFAVLAEYQAVHYKDLAARFELVQPNAYNFVDVSVLFETLLGESYENVSVIFSIVKESQSFKSYILQKLYCVVSYPEGNFYYDVVLRNWNVSPNKTWFVSVIGYAVDEYETGNLITLYDTLTDMQTHTNAVSYGYLNTDTLEVVLTAVDEYDEDPAYYYQDLQYHLMLSGVVAEGDEYTYKVKPLTDLDEIRHPIYNNSNIAISRGEAELDLHTYAVLGRELVLGIHLPILEPGDIANLTSARRHETTKKSQILGETISGSISDDGTASLITSINVANYLELSR